MMYLRRIKAEKLKSNLYAETNHKGGNHSADADESAKKPADDNGRQFNAAATEANGQAGLAGQQDHQPVTGTCAEGGSNIKITAESDGEEAGNQHQETKKHIAGNWQKVEIEN